MPTVSSFMKIYLFYMVNSYPHGRFKATSENMINWQLWVIAPNLGLTCSFRWNNEEAVLSCACSWTSILQRRPYLNNTLSNMYKGFVWSVAGTASKIKEFMICVNTKNSLSFHFLTLRVWCVHVFLDVKCSMCFCCLVEECFCNPCMHKCYLSTPWTASCIFTHSQTWHSFIKPIFYATYASICIVLHVQPKQFFQHINNFFIPLLSLIR